MMIVVVIVVATPIAYESVWTQRLAGVKLW